MYRLLLSLIFSESVIALLAQNLVPDPGFEIHNPDCEPYPGLTHWFNPNLATPDLYCTGADGCGIELTEFNMEEWGQLPPDEGNCYIGLFCCLAEISYQSRDYFYTALTEPLLASEIYQVSFIVSRVTSFDYAIDKLGVYFSQEPLSDPDGALPLPVQPQVETSGQVLQPDTAWITISGEFVAEGGEQYLTIGCFRDYDELTIVDTETSETDSEIAYYLFDDVQVSIKVGVEETESQFNIAVIGHQLVINFIEPCNIEVFNMAGQVCLSEQCAAGNTVLYAGKLPKGIYLVSAQFGRKTIQRKISIG